VTIRSLNHRANFCTVPISPANQLGTCSISRRCSIKSRRAKIINSSDDAGPVPLRYLDRNGDSAPRFRLHRSQDQADDLRLPAGRLF